MDLNGLCEVLVRYFRAGAVIFAGEYQDEIRSTECNRCAIGMYQDTLAAVLRQSHCFVHIWFMGPFGYKILQDCDVITKQIQIHLHSIYVLVLRKFLSV